jgi:hypothetical protein
MSTDYNILIFLIIFLILFYIFNNYEYFNDSSGKSFWSAYWYDNKFSPKISYPTERHMIPKINYNIVISRYNKNVCWANKLKNNYINIIVYDKENNKNPHNIPVNKGQEASSYLKYIVDYYDNLPDFTFFTHDEEYSWHHSGSIIDKFDEAVSSNKLYYNINDKCILGSIKNEWYDEIKDWYNKYIEKYIPMSSLPNKDWTVGYRGSAQFLVHKSIIRRLPKEFYKDLYNWIITTDEINYKTSRFMEWTWHIFWDIYPNL